MAAEATFLQPYRAPTLASRDSGITVPGLSAGPLRGEGPWATSSGVPTVGRSSGKSGQTASQLQRLKVAWELRGRLAAFPGDRPTVGTLDDVAQGSSPVRGPRKIREL